VLDRSFDAAAPNRKWIADFTYVWTTEGWLYVGRCRRSLLTARFGRSRRTIESRLYGGNA
jgi:transposase InsO family protein